MSLLTDDMSTRRTPARPEIRNAPITQPAAQRMSDSYQAMKAQLCQQVIEQLEALGSNAEALGQRMLREEIEQAITIRSRRGQLALNSAERLLLIEDVEDEVAGLGPLAPLLRDPTDRRRHRDRLQQCLCRAQRSARKGRDALSRRYRIS